MEKTKNAFEELFKLDVNDRVEKKKSGGTELTYLSWAWAWAEIKKLFPEANYIIQRFGDNQLPYVYDEKTGYMVFTQVSINEITHEMWLPVMDGANNAMKAEPYTYEVNNYEWNPQTRKKELNGKIKKRVEAATMFDINKTIMRCLTKNLAMFGLGLYIYAGEDLPESDDTPAPKEEPKPKSEPKGNNTNELISDREKKRLFAIAGSDHAQLAREIMLKYGYTSSKDILKKDYEKICNEIEAAVKGGK